MTWLQDNAKLFSQLFFNHKPKQKWRQYAKIQPELLDELEQLLFGMQSLKAAELNELLEKLNQKKFVGCPIGDDHVALILKGDLTKELKDTVKKSKR